MKNNSNYPTISVVIATYNSERTIEQCLHSIRSQRYPQNKIEIIVADGGSNDNTKGIAKKYGAYVIDTDPRFQNAEYNKSIGIQKARHEILAMIDHDNILPHAQWLSCMIQPFLNHPDVVGVETLRYHYDRHTSLLDRYFALYGAVDPLVWYMGKTDRLSYIYDSYVLAGDSRDKGNYYIVQFNKKNIPTVGANGFLVRRKLLMDNADTAPGKYFDMDVNVDLVNKGYNTYAFVKDSILHLTGYGSLGYFLKRRLLFLTQYRFGPDSNKIQKVRRYGSLTNGDIGRLIWAIFVCFTFIVPLIDSIRGWRKIHDPAWFLHPFLSFSFVVIYAWVIIRRKLGDIICFGT